MTLEKKEEERIKKRILLLEKLLLRSSQLHVSSDQDGLQRELNHGTLRVQH
jgi:hypothetical protein